VRLARDGRRDLDTVRLRVRNGVSRRVTGARDLLRLTLRDATQRLTRRVERGHDKIAAISGKLNVLSPLATLGRGYSIALSIDGKALSKASQFKKGAAFTLKVQGGSVDATTNDVRKESA
jgi:exodeoxyribonuclease VII large subunit